MVFSSCSNTKTAFCKQNVSGQDGTLQFSALSTLNSGLEQLVDWKPFSMSICQRSVTRRRLIKVLRFISVGISSTFHVRRCQTFLSKNERRFSTFHMTGDVGKKKQIEARPEKKLDSPKRASFSKKKRREKIWKQGRCAAWSSGIINRPVFS